MTYSAHRLLRRRDRDGAAVSNVELFFDLVYAFAVTQLSHALLHGLDPSNALKTVVLWFAVWLGWQYTCWVTNWFNPDAGPVRALMFVLMGLALVMSSVIPDAYEHGGLVFAAAYVAIQVGRTLFVLIQLGRDHELSPNFVRMLAWLVLSGCFWIAGGLLDDTARLALWIAAVMCEYVAPMIGFAFPGLGRSTTADWTIAGSHLAERCQLFVIVALGEGILTTGAVLSESQPWTAPLLIALAVAFIGSMASWWIYFDTSSEDGSAAISASADPGKIGARFHYVHVILIGGIIVMATADHLVLATPARPVTPVLAATLIGGPAIYLVGCGLYKMVVYQSFPWSHGMGLAALAILAPLALLTDLLMAGGLAVLILISVAILEGVFTRKAQGRTETTTSSD